MSEPKIPKLKKDGTLDKRGETSKLNLAKGKSVVMDALKKVKQEKQEKKIIEKKEKSHGKVSSIYYSSDDFSTDEEEVEITTLIKGEVIKVDEVISDSNIIPESLPVLERKITDDGTSEKVKNTYKEKLDSNIVPESLPAFTFEKKYLEELDNIKNTFNKKFEVINNETNILKEQNNILKKQLTTNFRTHTGILNQEMFLKF